MQYRARGNVHGSFDAQKTVRLFITSVLFLVQRRDFMAGHASN